MTTYRAGVIGLNLGQSHVRGFDEADGVEVAAVCDIDESRLEEVADQYDVAGRYTDATAMLEAESLDIVSVTTPAALHPMMTLLAARYPVQAIISEKPLANSMGEADAMLATCNAAGIKLLCGYQGRHMRAFERARGLIADGAIGKPLVVKVSVEEGGLLNQGSHLIDRSLYLLGDPEPLWVLGQVQRETDRYERGYYCEDLCFCIAAVEGGARIVYDNDIGPGGDVGNRAFVVTGDDGMLIVEPSDPAISMSYGVQLISGNREDLNEPWDGVATNFMLAAGQRTRGLAQRRHRRPPAERGPCHQVTVHPDWTSTRARAPTRWFRCPSRPSWRRWKPRSTKAPSRSATRAPTTSAARSSTPKTRSARRTTVDEKRFQALFVLEYRFAQGVIHACLPALAGFAEVEHQVGVEPQRNLSLRGRPLLAARAPVAPHDVRHDLAGGPGALEPGVVQFGRLGIGGDSRVDGVILARRRADVARLKLGHISVPPLGWHSAG